MDIFISRLTVWVFFGLLVGAGVGIGWAVWH